MKQKYFLRGLSIGLLCAIVVFTVSNMIHSRENKDSNTVATATATPAPDATGVLADNAASENLTSTTPAATAAATAAPNQETGAQTTPATGTTTEVPTVTVTAAPGVAGSASQTPGTKNGTVLVEVKSGMTSAQVCEKLESQGAIADAAEFNTYMSNRGYADKIKVGTHEVPMNATYEQVADALCDNNK